MKKEEQEQEQVFLTETDRDYIKASIKDISNIMSVIALKRDEIKEAVVALHETYQIPKKDLNKMIKVYHAQSFNEEVNGSERLIELYESIFDTNKKELD